MVVKDENMETETSKPFLRSHAMPYDKNKDCVICCKKNPVEQLAPVRTPSVHEKLHRTAQINYELLTRLQNSFDGIAGDVLYHKICLLNHVNSSDRRDADNASLERDKVFQELRKEIEAQTCRGQAVLLSDCWERFQELCHNKSVEIPYYYLARNAFFKEALMKGLSNTLEVPKQSSQLEDDILIAESLLHKDICNVILGTDGDELQMKLPAYNQNEMNQMVHVALYLRGLIMSHPNNTKAELTEDNAYASISEGLYVFLAIMFGGSDAIDTDADAEVELEEHEKAWSLRRSILNLCQDITYVISEKRIIPPKHYSMGLTIHQIC